MLSLGSTAGIRQLVHFELVDAATISKKEQAIVTMRDQQMTYRVIFARGHTCLAPASSALRAIGTARKPLDVAFFGQRHYNFFIRNEVFVLKLTGFGFPKVGTAGIAIFLF